MQEGLRARPKRAVDSPAGLALPGQMVAKRKASAPSLALFRRLKAAVFLMPFCSAEDAECTCHLYSLCNVKSAGMGVLGSSWLLSAAIGCGCQRMRWREVVR